MSDDTNPTTGPASEEAPDETPADTSVETSAGAPTEEGRTGQDGDDDGGAALERAQEAIDDAQDAQGSVAAHDDITTRDDAVAGKYSEDPGGEGGHP